MKKLLMAVCVLMLGVYAFASDIEQVEDIPDIAIWRLDTVKFLVFTETCEVTYRKGYMDGADFIGSGKETTIRFQNIADNPETPEDETSTEFTQIIAAINAGSNIKQTITNAVKIKLGI